MVGAGPAGMMCAGTASQNGANVTLLEKNDGVGKKLMITGKGRCNVTNNCDASDFIKSVPTNGRFLYSAINSFSPQDVINFFEKEGCLLKTERGNRVFPKSDRSKDVVDALLRFLKKSDVKLEKKVVKEILTCENKVFGVKTDSEDLIKADAVVIACGGKSYPGTGSTGDGYKMAKKLGHAIVTPKPSLVPLVVEQDFCKDLQGLSLKNVSIKVVDKKGDKVIYKDFGEMLFTHYGVSGPVILSASAHMKDMQRNRYSVIIDLKPALDNNQLDLRVRRDLSKNLHKDFINSLYELLPKKLIPVAVRLSGIKPDTKCDQITKEMRREFVNLLKGICLDVKDFRPLNEAIVTSGGVSVKEINPKTMESKFVDGLYFAGEVIDVDAYTGGFNLQIAFSTGYLAGISSAKGFL